MCKFTHGANAGIDSMLFTGPETSSPASAAPSSPPAAATPRRTRGWPRPPAPAAPGCRGRPCRCRGPPVHGQPPAQRGMLKLLEDILYPRRRRGRHLAVCCHRKRIFVKIHAGLRQQQRLTHPLGLWAHSSTFLLSCAHARVCSPYHFPWLSLSTRHRNVLGPRS